MNSNFNSIFISNNGGNSFQETTNYPNGYGQNQETYSVIKAFENLMIISCTYPGNVFYSTNGLDWQSTFGNESYVEIINENLIFITNDNLLVSQENFGDWEQNFVMPEKIRKIYFYNDNLGFVLGENGMIYKTTNMGGLLSTNELDKEKKNIFLHPNPAAEKIKIQMPKDETIKKIEIYNSTGQKIDEKIDDNNELNISNLNSGMYILKVFTQNNIYSEKFYKK